MNELEGERTLGYCQDCYKYDYLDDMEGGIFCDDCGKQYKIVQICSKCETWHLTTEEYDQLCQKCDDALKNPTVAQRKELLGIETEVNVRKTDTQSFIRIEPKPLAKGKMRVEKKKKRKLIYQKQGDKEVLIFDSEFWSDKYSLKEGQTFKEYVQYCDKNKPYGEDKYGMAFLFPHNTTGTEVSWRPDMKYRSDWGGLRRTGIGWRIPATLPVLLIFFLPQMILWPLFYIIFGYAEFFWTELIRSLIASGVYIALALYFVRLIAYAQIKVDEIVKPYGVEHESLQLLFRDKLEYLKWSKKLVADTINLKLFTPGVIGFLLYGGWTIVWVISSFLDYQTWDQGNLVNDVFPIWTIIPTIFSNFGIALVLLLILGFFGAVIYGLFRVGDLSMPYQTPKVKGHVHYKDGLIQRRVKEKKRSILSIYSYSEMINTIKNKLTEAQMHRKRMTDLLKVLDKRGKTYYEFQRGNRKIGEYLFNIATFLILLCIIATFLLWLISLFNLLPGLEGNQLIFSFGLFVFAIVSFGIFLFPQLNLHKYLKEFKIKLIDSFSFILSRLEYIYFESMIDTSILGDMDLGWKNRESLLKDIDFIKKTIEDVNHMGHGVMIFLK